MFRLVFIICTLITMMIMNGEGFERLFRNSSLHKKVKRSSDNEKKSENDSKYSVCRSKECFKVASELWESMNSSVNPCENFYEYACGGWPINNPIPPTEMSWSNMAKDQKRIRDRMRKLLEENIQQDDILPVRQLKKFYRSCMNVEAIESTGLKRLEGIISRSGGWPMAMELEEWDQEGFTWQQIDQHYLELTSSSAFYNIWVDEDNREINSVNYEDPDYEPSQIISLGPADLPPVLMKKPYTKFNRTSLYETGNYAKLITGVALIFAKARDTIIDENQLAIDVQEMIEFEKKLGKNLEKNEEKFKSLGELQKYYNNLSNETEISKINWKAIISDYFADANVKVNEDEEIRILPFLFLEKIEKIFNETKPRTIVNYVHWYFLTQFLSYTTNEMRKLKYDLAKAVAGVEEETPRTEMCVEAMRMEHAIAYLFVKKYFTNDMIKHAEKMFSGIQKATIRHILMADWLDDKMRKIQLQKMNKMKMFVGFPDWYNNASAVKNYYRGMAIGTQFLDNLLSVELFSRRKMLRSLRQTDNTEEWLEFNPLEVNAYYNSMNYLIVPSGRFQTPFYSPTLPPIITYGNLGAILGHEVSHGTDVEGIKVDEDGKETSYSFNGIFEYNKRSTCFINQFEDYYENKTDHSKESLLEKFWNILTFSSKIEEAGSRLTQGENMADTMGVKMIFEVLKKNENENNSPRFPGFEDMTNEQFFFLSYANIWCENSTSEYKDLMRNYDVHSEARYRVTAVIQNSVEFAKAFKCPKNSPMNPEKKCKIW